MTNLGRAFCLSKKQSMLKLFACIPGFLAANASYAQADPDESRAAQQSSLEEVVVTGSRISNPGFVSPAPVSSVSTEEIALAPPKLFDFLTTLPKFRNSATNVGATAATTSGQYLNLRSFGPARTLILLDGMRLPLSQERGGVDVSLIPEQLVSRVDVITGGASAAYGSDAIAGAVNFILDTGFEGLKGEVAGGRSTYGDAGSIKVAGSFGTPFADDRGHLIGSLFYHQQDGITPLNTNRDWFAAGGTNISSPTGVRPSVVTYMGGARYLASPAGVITAGPLAGTTFGPGGVPQPFVFGSPRDTTAQIGGDGATLSPPSIIGDQDRINAFAHAEYELSDNAVLFVEGAAARERNTSFLQPNYSITANAVTIFSDNAYLSQEMRNRMQAAGVTSFRLENIWTDSPSEAAVTEASTMRVRAGIRGEFTSDWTYNGLLQFSRSKVHAHYPNTMQWKNLFAAVDAVTDPATGQIVCRSTLQGLTPGCVPINLMGPGAKTEAAYNYVTFAQDRQVPFNELNVSLSSQRPIFRLWSDEAAILAAGVEYKFQDGRQTANTVDLILPDYTGIRGVPTGRLTNPGFDIGGFLSWSGRTTATEGFAELNVPVVDSLPLLHLLSVNTAVRYTKYDPSGPATTYKIGLVYEPIDFLRLRSSFSRDMRAPSLYEMFLPRTPGTNVTVVTPFGVIPQTGFSSGNTALRPERAYDYTIGAVVQPPWLPGFGASIDYFNIKMKDGIGSPGTAQQIADACYLNNSAFACSLITLAPDRSIATFYYPIVNNTIQRTEGIDFELGYRTELAGGQLSLRAFATYTPTFTSVVSGAPVINVAGQVGNSKWISSGNVNYAIGPATVSLSARYLSATRINVTFTEGNQVSNNSVPAMTYLDAAFLYDFALGDQPKFQAFLQVSNLLDKEPPPVMTVGGAQRIYTNYVVYDGIGRYFTAGLRMNW